MRSLILLLIGLATGAVFTLMGMNYLHQGTGYPEGVMAVMREQMKALNHSIKQNRCGASDLTPRIQMLRLLANDIEPAFGEMPNNEQFVRYASDLRAATDAVLMTAPTSCSTAATAFGKIKKTCENCHRDYKN